MPGGLHFLLFLLASLGLLHSLFLLFSLDHGVFFLAGKECVRQGAQDDLDGTEGVIVAGDDNVNKPGVAVGVHEGNDRNSTLSSLANRDMLSANVHGDQGRGEFFHFPQPVKVGENLSAFSPQPGDLLLGVLLNFTGFLESFQFNKSLEALADGVEICQAAAKPALGDIVILTAFGFSLHN